MQLSDWMRNVALCCIIPGKVTLRERHWLLDIVYQPFNCIYFSSSFPDPLHRPSDHLNLMRKYFQEYLVENSSKQIDSEPRYVSTPEFSFSFSSLQDFTLAEDGFCEESFPIKKELCIGDRLGQIVILRYLAESIQRAVLAKERL